jgi:hypothetical protein
MFFSYILNRNFAAIATVIATSILSVFLFPSSTYALSENKTDCGIVRAHLVANGGEIDVDDFNNIRIHESLYPSDAIGLALRHLQSFCCQEKIFRDDPSNDDEIKLCKNVTDE